MTSKRLITDAAGVARCFWCGADPLYIAYHDQEWGFPMADDRRLFEKICLEGFQSGLSWLTILRKRENFRGAFAQFDIEKVARFTPRDIKRLLNDAGIVRHRGKIESAVNNARRALELQREFGSLAAYFWRYQPRPSKTVRLAPTSPQSLAMSKDLRRRGWSFVGPTTLHAFMQAVGLVNDHFPGCHVRSSVEKAARRSFPQSAFPRSATTR